MPSFDVVSEVDRSEVKNAFNQAEKELAQRYDFKGADASIELVGDNVQVRANSEDRVLAAWDLMVGKLARRNVSLRHFDPGKVEHSGQAARKMAIAIKEGIPTDKAKQVVKAIKDGGYKVQASIVEDSVRVTGKKKDDLQEVISFLRGKADDLELSLQFKNFRD
ncbi:MAG TPA: YajQ family cyclic di-GMP-binding protein [Polyangiaceae bacterium]|nr:YajQ family cyclic di-GMP-binding protein [Polyangiaceae bacterium]